MTPAMLRSAKRKALGVEKFMAPANEGDENQDP